MTAPWLGDTRSDTGGGDEETPADPQPECEPCARGDHTGCTDDGRYGSHLACECARGTHGPNGIGVI